MVEGCNCIQKDWLGLASLRARGLHKARLHAALAMLSEAVNAYTGVQKGVAKGLTRLAIIT